MPLHPQHPRNGGVPSTEPAGAAPARAGGILCDTTPDADRVQRESYLRLGGRERVAILFRLNETVRRLALAGIRGRHPDYSKTHVRQAYARLVLGDALVRESWPDRDLVDP